MQPAVVRKAGPGDLDTLVSSLDQPGYFEDRLERQHQSLGVLLVAWLQDRPVGDVYLWLEPAFEDIVRAQLPGVPLLTHLEVLPTARNRGIGTELVAQAEAHLSALDFERAALSVGETNKDAYRLYERLGYAEWQHGTITTFSEAIRADGSKDVTADAEPSRIMVKALRRPSDR
jgi:GNAT superfamily N-acetyltransferase